jgi:hypothetical protein
MALLYRTFEVVIVDVSKVAGISLDELATHAK